MNQVTANQAAALLAGARKSGVALTDFPAELLPLDRAAAYAIQNALIDQAGSVGAWKVAAGSAEPICAPILAADVFASGSNLDLTATRATGVEIEIGFKFGSDLPPRSEPYSVKDIRDAIEGALPAIEIIGSNFVPDFVTPALLATADLQVNVAIVLGNVVKQWGDLHFGTVQVGLTVGAQAFDAHTGTSTDAVMDALVWLANHGSPRLGGIRKGQVVITGARINAARSGGVERVTGSIAGLGTVWVQFG